MKVAITGATGFVGRELVSQFARENVQMKCWHRKESDLSPLADFESNIKWIEGELADGMSATSLVSDCDAVVHSGLWRSGKSFQANESDAI